MRYKFDKDTGKVVPAHIVEAKQQAARQTHYVLPDIDVAYNGGFESPIDGQFITSRSQLKEHNIRHNVIQAGDIRGERLKSDMKKFMRYDPKKRTANGFSWTDPSPRSGNLTEI